MPALLAGLFIVVSIAGPAYGRTGLAPRSSGAADCQVRFLAESCVRPGGTGKPARPGAGPTLEAASTPVSGFVDESVFGGLVNPTVIRFSPDGRVFVAEKSGLIKVFSSLTDTTPTVFADLRTDVHNFWDRGLLGLALHPSFPSTPYVYAAYTYDHILGATATGPRWGAPGVAADPCPTPPGPTTDGCVVSSRVVRLQASTANPDVSTGTQQVLVEDWCQQYPSHSIGSVAFGPDGMLYASGGDGASFAFADYGQGASTSTSAGFNVCGDPGSAPGVRPTSAAGEGGALRSQDLRTTTPGTSPAYRTRILSDGPLRYWRLGEASGTVVVDETGSGVNGTYVNTPTLGAPGALSTDTNRAVTFASASVEFVNLNNAAGYPSGNAARSIEAWIRTSTVAEQGIVDYGNYASGSRTFFGVHVSGDGRLMVSTDSEFPVFGPAGTLTDGAWHHVVVTYDGSALRAYRDGILMSGSPFTPGAALATSTLNRWIANTGTRTFNGTIDEVAIYARALTLAEIQAHVQAASSATPIPDPVTLDGTVIRIDPTTGAGAAGNPLASSSDANARRIVAHGFRNPFRFTFRPGTGELWVGDVGWGEWEEIQRIVTPTSGPTNAGWPCYEGTGRQSSYDAAELPICENLYGSGTHAGPYYTYFHASDVVTGDACTRANGSAVAGLAFYPTSGAPYPATYAGALFFADHNRNCIWAMLRGGNGLPDPSTIRLFVGAAANPVHLELGPDGMIYYVDFEGHGIHRLRFLGSNTPPAAIATATPSSGPPPLAVQLDASQSSDPDQGQTLSYSWDVDGDGTFGEATGVAPSWTYQSAGTFQVRVRVSDSAGASTTSAPVTVTVGTPNTAPTAIIEAPTTSDTWIVGSQLAFSGRGTDTEDGTIPATSMHWDIVQQHCPSACHPHTVTSVDDVASGTFVAPDHEYPTFIDVTLTVTDSAGVSASTTVRIHPRTVDLTFATSPSGLTLTHNSTARTAPFTFRAIIGSSNAVSAAATQTVGGVTYTFAGWSDGGSATHQITAPATAATYTATYTATSADLRIVKAAVTDRPADRVTFTLSATNLGPASASTVVVRDTLVSRLTHISSSSSQGTCAYSSSTRTVTCQVGTMAAGATVTVTIVTRPNRWRGSVSNTGTVTTSTSDPVTSNDSSTISVQLR
jgi:uncharacterized repeat protein (TIGR01451 family)